MSLNLKNKDREQDEQEVDDGYDPQQQVVWQGKVCDLPEIPVVTGEEQEETIANFRSKIYRWRTQWKERGVGDLKFLKHKKSGLIRILVRADKTHKCIVNHLVQAVQIFCKLEQMKTSNNAWTWAAYDISDQQPKNEKLCAKFTSKQDFQKFKQEFEKACEQNAKILSQGKEKAQGKGQEKAQENKQKTQQKKQQGQKND